MRQRKTDVKAGQSATTRRFGENPTARDKVIQQTYQGANQEKRGLRLGRQLPKGR